MRRHRPALAAVALGCLVIGDLAAAQATTGRIAGTVADAAGRAVAGVTVTVVEAETAYTRRTVTNARGTYAFPSLPLGTYHVTAELPGLQKGVAAGRTLVADGRLVADFVLEAQALEVSGVEPARAEAVVGSTRTGDAARAAVRTYAVELPLDGQRYLPLTALAAGTPQLMAGALASMANAGAGPPGEHRRPGANVVSVDGGPSLAPGSGDSRMSDLSVNLVGQIDIATSIHSAAHGGGPGAAIAVATRSGTNRFGGSAFDTVRRDGLDANGYFANLKGVAKVPFASDNFGFTAGGPLAPDRVFLFGGVEWTRTHRFASPALRSLPTSAMRSGDFRSLPNPIKDPYTGTPFPNNVIPENRITADGRAIARVYARMATEAASYDDTKASDNAVFGNLTSRDARQEVLRVDLRPPGAHRVTVRLVADQDDLDDPAGTLADARLPTVPTRRHRPALDLQVNHTWLLRSHVANEFRMTHASGRRVVEPVGETWKRSTYGFTFPRLYEGGAGDEPSIPSVTISHAAGFDGASGLGSSSARHDLLADNLTVQTGRHTIQAGGLVGDSRQDRRAGPSDGGTIGFSVSGNVATTGYAFADALLGNFRTYREAQASPVSAFRFRQVEAFVSDTWRIGRRLSADVGLRYAWQTPAIALGTNTSRFDPALYRAANAATVNTDGTIVPGSGDRLNGLTRPGAVSADQASPVPTASRVSASQLPTAANRGGYPDQHLLAPRAGMSWKPTARGSTVVRGSVGLFYDHPDEDFCFALAKNPPFVLSATFQNGNLSNPDGGTPAALAPWATVVSVDPNLRSAAEWTWSLSVERALPWPGLSGALTYVGSQSAHLLRHRDINAPSFDDLSKNVALRYSTDYWRPYKGFSAIEMYVSDGRADSNALQVFLRRRGRLGASMNYTYSASHDTASGNPDGFDPGAANRAYDYGPSNSDRRHALVMAWTCPLPSWPALTGWKAALLAGWELSGIYRYQSGTPFTVTGSTAIGTRRADFLGGTPYQYRVDPVTGTVTWLDATRFAVAPEGRLGNSGRNAFVGPSYRDWDLSVSKVFTLPGRMRLQVDATFLNAFNQVRWNNPAANITGSSPFGTITSAAPPRTGRLEFRLTF